MIYGGRRWLAWTFLAPSAGVKTKRLPPVYILGPLDGRGGLRNSETWLQAGSPEELRAKAAFRGIGWDTEVWEDYDWAEL